jgi:hypothetical protein
MWAISGRLIIKAQQSDRGRMFGESDKSDFLLASRTDCLLRVVYAVRGSQFRVRGYKALFNHLPVPISPNEKIITDQMLYSEAA